MGTPSNKNAASAAKSAARKAAQASRSSKKFGGRDKHNGASVSQSGQKRR